MILNVHVRATEFMTNLCKTETCIGDKKMNFFISSAQYLQLPIHRTLTTVCGRRCHGEDAITLIMINVNIKFTDHYYMNNNNKNADNNKQ